VTAAIDWVPQTKIQPPRLRSDVVPRDRLIDWLDEKVPTHPLCLISAPAGYGKTTMLAAWMERPKAQIRKAYLLLDEEDDDPLNFLSGLLASLRRLSPSFGKNLVSLLELPTAPGLRKLYGVMINEVILTLPDPFALILDDYHLISTPEIHDALDYLVERLPGQMHLVISTRADPLLALARLRARGQLAELRLPSLRFTLAETQDFINQRLGLDLPDQVLRQLQTSAEGWAAGLRLLAASLENTPESGSGLFDPGRAANNRDLFDVLADEVLNRQPLLLREFLLETSILHELTPDLCRAVTKQPDAHLLLEEIHRRNLFTVVQDEARDRQFGYRYHALFRTFLLQQLIQERTPEAVAVLHRLAGAAEDNLSQAVAHFITAQAWDEAADKIEQAAEKLFSQGQLDRLRGWISALPASTMQDHPWLCYFAGVCAWGKNDFVQAQIALELALENFRLRGDRRGEGETLIQLSIIHQTASDFQTAARCLRPVDSAMISPRSRVQLHLSRAWIALGCGNLEEAQAELASAIEEAEKHPPGALQLLAMQVRLPFGALPQAAALFQRTAQLIEPGSFSGPDPWQAGADALWMLFYFLRGDLRSAVLAGERAFSASEALGGLSWLLPDLCSIFPRLLFLSGETARSKYVLEQFRAVFDYLPGWRASALYLHGLSLWDAGQHEEARLVYEQMQVVPSGYEWPAGAFARVCMEGLLSLSDRDYPHAEKCFVHACQLWQDHPVSRIVGDPRLLLAAAYYGWGRPSDALRVIELPLAEHRRNATPGLLLIHGTAVVDVLGLAVERGILPEFAAPLLQSLESLTGPRSQTVSSTGETLTAREVEILRLLSTGASNAQIADSLVIGLPTVKTHVSRVLAKLDARSRTEAVTVARDLRIL